MTNNSGDAAKSGTYSCPNCGTVNHGSPDHCRRCGAKIRPRSSSIGPGTIIDGKYEVLGLLGVGGMGEVFKVRHIHLEAVRCVKVMKTDLMQDEAYTRRFVREAKVATRVHHPNVAIVHDFATLEDGTYYMVHEYIDGITVRQWLARNGRLPLGMAITLTLQVLSGLQHCHARGLLHRDISADNIMITLDDEERPAAKIIDLGIAKVTEASEVTQRTMAGIFIGNPKYSSPEQLGQLREGEELDARTDLYSLGITLYEMVVGVPPFYSRTPQGYMMQHLQSKVTPFHEVDATIELPDGFEEVVLHALEKDREKRYPSARDFARALRPFLKDLEENEDAWVRMIFRELPSRQAALRSRADEPIAEEPVLKKTVASSSDDLLDEERWRALDTTEDIDDLRAYLASNPGGTHADEVKRRVDLYDRIESLEAEGNLDDLLTIGPTVHQIPVLAERVRAAIERLERGEKVSKVEIKKTVAMAMPSSTGDDDAWRDADTALEIAPLRRYLDEFPNGQNADEAQRRIDLFARIEELERQREVTSLRVLEVSVRDIPLLATRIRTAIETVDRETTPARDEPESSSDAGASMPDIEMKKTVALETPPPPPDFELKKTVAIPVEVPDVPGAAEADDERDWERAMTSGSAEAWDDYITNHPDSARRAQAEAFRDEAIAFDDAVYRGTTEAWTAFLDAWPDGRKRLDAEMQRGLAKQRAERAAWDEAFEQQTADAWRAYVDAHGDSSRIDEARQHLDEAEEFESASMRNDRPTLERYLEKWPEGPHATLARTRIAELLTLEAEEAFLRAKESDSPAAMEAFIHAHPDSERAAEARAMLDSRRTRHGEKTPAPSAPSETTGGIPLWAPDTPEEDALEIAIAQGTSRGFRRFLRHFPESPERERVQGFFEEALAWERTSTRAEVEQFLKVYPDGLNSASARHRIVELSEDDDYSAAERENTIESWSRFLDDHPAGQRADEASRKLAALKADEERKAADAELANDIRRYESEDDLAALENLAAGLRYDHPLQLEAGEAAERVRSRKEAAERAARENDDWRKAESEGTREALESFIQSHPQSHRSARARLLIDELTDWGEIRRTPTLAGLQSFVTRWPDSRFRLDAEREIESLRRPAAPAPGDASIAPTQHEDDVPIAPTRHQDVPIPLRTVMMESTEPEPSTAPESASSPVLSAPAAGPRKSRLGLVVAIVAVLAVIGVAVFMMLRPPGEPEPAPSPVPGTLVVDASPWAQIASIKNANGTEMLEGGAKFTPGLFTLPSGTYTIILENPEASGETKSRTVVVSAGAQTTVRETLDSIDATQYFALEGWR